MAAVSPRTASVALTILTPACCSHPHPAAASSPRPTSALYDLHTLPNIISAPSLRLSPIHLHRCNPVQQKSLIFVGSKRPRPSIKQPTAKRGDLLKVSPPQLQVNCQSLGGSNSGSSSSSSSPSPRPSSLYSILGVDQSVAIPEIKRAFRNLALQYHPDVLMARSPAPSPADANQKFLQLQDAYRLLSDPKLRAEYDRHHLMPECAGDEITIFDCNWRSGVRMGGRWSRRSSCTDDNNLVQRSFWKWQWEAQIQKLRGWGVSGTPAEQISHGRQISTWGSRMRSQNSRSHNIA